ncbi:MAG: hypothetical protein ACT4O1_12310 [Gemmatimonadota bacterium]
MQIAKLGLLAAIIIGAVLGVLWATDMVPAEDITTMARNAYIGLAILVIAAVALRAVRGSEQPRDQTDKPVP